MTRTVFSYLLLLILICSCNSPKEHTLFVNSVDNTSDSSYQNLHQAFKKVRALRNEGEKGKITIYLSSGTHRLEKAITIKPSDGPIEFIGEGRDKTTIKGSQKLSLEWQPHKDNIWKAKVPEGIQFDQLYVDEQPQIIARYPNYDENGGHWQGYAADAIAKERIKKWSNPKGAVIHAMHRGEWGGFHYLVTGIDDKGELKLSGGHQNNRPSAMHPKYRMVENVFEELDAPGEWFLDDNNTLYFHPRSETTLETANIEIVQQKHLINILGTVDNPVKNVSMRGIRFEHTKRTLFEKYEPLLRSDWTVYRGGAIFMEGAEAIRIKDCEFTNLGGNAIFVSKYNRDVTVENNLIHNIGATAINLVGSPTAVRSPSFQYGQFVEASKLDTVRGPKNDEYPANCTIDNNLIYRIGRIEKQTSGVNISMAMDLTVSNNSIYEVPRAGINICDGTWGGHIIEYNDVFSTVLESGDHGAFNSWGRDRFWHPNRSIMDSLTENNPKMPLWDAIHTTVIRNNRFRCDHGWDIDLDDGSTNYKIENNVCLNGGIKLREGFYRTVENNITINNSFHPHVWFKNSGDVFKRNIVLTDYKDIWLRGWGKEVDYNFFPDKKALEKAQKNKTDIHSSFGDPMFTDVENADYTVLENSPALKVGFVNFPMDKFGVKDKHLKALARQPITPIIWNKTSEQKQSKVQWLGATLKNIETIEERSASGLNETSGVLVLEIKEGSVIAKSELKKGDVIIGSEGKKIMTMADLMNSYQGNNWKGSLELQIYRNQAVQKIRILLKK